MVTKKFKFANGDKVKEKITGFTGTITGTCYYLTGCNQYLIFPECKKSHKKPAGHWFDEERLALLEKEVVKATEVTSKRRFSRKGADTPAPGGSREY